MMFQKINNFKFKLCGGKSCCPIIEQCSATGDYLISDPDVDESVVRFTPLQAEGLNMALKELGF